MKRQVESMKKTLDKRIAELGALRDKVRNDISEFEQMADNIDEAIDMMQRAADSLSELV